MDTLRPIALVTGSSSGIGAALARVFARHGHELALVARRGDRLNALADEIAANGFNLDRKNPNAKDDFEHLPPEKLADDILQKELRIAEIMREIKELLGRRP